MGKCLICKDDYYCENQVTGEPEEPCWCGCMWNSWDGTLNTFIKINKLKGIKFLVMVRTVRGLGAMSEYLYCKVEDMKSEIFQ